MIILIIYEQLRNYQLLKNKTVTWSQTWMVDIIIKKNEVIKMAPRIYSFLFISGSDVDQKLLQSRNSESTTNLQLWELLLYHASFQNFETREGCVYWPLMCLTFTWYHTILSSFTRHNKLLSRDSPTFFSFSLSLYFFLVLFSSSFYSLSFPYHDWELVRQIISEKSHFETSASWTLHMFLSVL